MKDYSNYNSSPINKLIWSAKKVFESQLKFEGQEVKIQNNTIKAIVRNHGNPTNEFKEERFLISGKDIDIKRGYIVNYLDEDYIIITDIDRDNQVYNTCKMSKTNYILPWLNSKGDVCSSCIIVENATKYSDGIFENSKIKVGDTKIAVTFPENINTNEIQVGKRFLFDKEHCYEVSDTGVTSPKGLRVMMMVQTEIHNEIDNLDLLIADYYGNAHEYKMKIVNKTPILTIGDTYKLQVNMYDKDVKIDNPELNFDIQDTDILTIEGNTITALKEGKTSIAIRFKDIRKTINVQVIKEEVDNYTCEIEGENEVALERTKKYTGKFFNNGNEVDDIGVWSVVDENDKNTSYATIIKTEDNKCTIKITDKWIFADGKSKYFYLKLQGTTGKECVKKIRITPY